MYLEGVIEFFGLEPVIICYQFVTEGNQKYTDLIIYFLTI